MKTHPQSSSDEARLAGNRPDETPFDRLPIAEADASEESDDASNLDDFDAAISNDDAHWDVFISDDDELDPIPDPNDFWMDSAPE
jgi:hypothetical protein